MKYILLVEDDKSIASLVRLLFEWEHETVFVAYDCDHALALMALHGPPAVAILDYYLGDKTCEPCAEMIKEKFPGTPVVLMTAAHQAEFLAQRCHAARLIRKPFNTDELIDAVKHTQLAVR